MKKWISCLSVLIFPFVVNAQHAGVWSSFHEGHKGKDLITKTQRWVAAREKLPWVKTVERQVALAHPRGLLGKSTWDHINTLQNGKVNPAHAEVFNQRTAAWQAALKTNPTLQHFRVSAPDPHAVLRMPDEHARYIEGFLKAPTLVQKADKRFTPVGTETYKRFIVRVTLLPHAQAKPVHLVFNTFSRQMYVSYGQLNVPGVQFETLKDPVLTR